MKTQYRDMFRKEYETSKTIIYSERKFMVLNYLSRLKGGEKISYEKFAKEINVDRKTLMKWVKRYNEQGLSGLEDKSRRPKTSPFKTCKAIEEKVIELRKNTGFSSRRLKMEFELDIGHNTINRILKDNNLIDKQRKKKIKNKNNLREIKEKLNAFETIQIDIKYLRDIPELKAFVEAYDINYQITARDVKSGGAYIFYSRDKSISSTITATDILLTHLKSCGKDISKITIQTDNGSEFSGNRIKQDRGYTAHLRDRWNIKQRFIPPRYPNANADVETFHRIIEYEFFKREYYNNIKEFLDKSFTYLCYFNTIRKNSYRKYKTPLDYIKEEGMDQKCLFLPPVIIDRVILKKDKYTMNNYWLTEKYLYKNKNPSLKLVQHVPGKVVLLKYLI